MLTFKNCLSNLNFNYIYSGLLLFFFFYIKNLFCKLTNLYQLHIIVLNKLCNNIKIISKKNKKNYNKFSKKFSKKFKKNYKKIKKILKNNKQFDNNISNNCIELNKIIEVIPPIVESNCITVDVDNDVDNDFEIIEIKN
jgi:hypothetical protein